MILETFILGKRKLKKNEHVFLKEDIIEALRTEPLTPGRWILDTGLDCRVCAVGAVLRSAGIRNCVISVVGNIIAYRCDIARDTSAASEELLEAVRQGHFLAALSGFFETQCAQLSDLSLIREACVAFVEQHFPEAIMLRTAEGLV